MGIRRRPASTIALIALGALALTACGGDDGSGDAEPETTSEVAEAAEETGGGEVESEPDSGGETPAGDASTPLELLMSIPSSGGLGESIELSPDGTQLAHFTGGLGGEVVVYDVASATEVGRFPSQALSPIIWTDGGQVVAWDPGPTIEGDPSVQAIDVATGTDPGLIAATYPSGFVDCELPFGDFESAANGRFVFAVGSLDAGGTQLCRLDTSTFEVTGVEVPTAGPLPRVVADRTGTAVAVIDEGGDVGGSGTAYEFDASSLSGPTVIELPGQAKGYVDGQLLVLAADRMFTTLDGTPFAQAVEVAASPLAISFELTSDVLLVNDSTGAPLGSIAVGFPSDADASSDGSVAAVLVSDSIEVVRTR